MSIILEKDLGNQGASQASFPNWFNIVEESLKRCMPSKRKQYIKELLGNKLKILETLTGQAFERLSVLIAETQTT